MPKFVHTFTKLLHHFVTAQAREVLALVPAPALREHEMGMVARDGIDLSRPVENR